MQTIFWWRTPVELVHLEDREGNARILELWGWGGEASGFGLCLIVGFVMSKLKLWVLHKARQGREGQCRAAIC